jgi:hypothetical protein
MSNDEIPPDIVCKSIGLIRKYIPVDNGDGEWRWLVHQPKRNSWFQLIETDRLEKESFRQALDREIAWILPLRAKQDYLMSSVPRLHYRHKIEPGCGSNTGEPMQIMTQCTEFYTVDLYGKEAEKQTAHAPGIDWITSLELTQGQWTREGELRLLLPAQTALLEMSQVVSHWEGTADWS